MAVHDETPTGKIIRVRREIITQRNKIEQCSENIPYRKGYVQALEYVLDKPVKDR